MPLDDKIKELRPGVEGLELGENRVFTAKTDVECRGGEGGKRARFSEKRKPSRGISLGVKESEGMAKADEFVPDFDITPHSAEDLDVGQDGGDFQSRTSKRFHRFILN